MNGLAGSDVGLAAVTAVLVTYAFEARSRWFVLAFAISCWLGSAYGFLQGGLAVRSARSDLGFRRAQTVVAWCVRENLPKA